MKSFCVMLISAALLIGLLQAPLNSSEDSEKNEESDIFLVLDNSGSMKINDPKFLTREVVGNFLNSIGEQNRLGMVIFDREAVLAQSLSFISDDDSREHFFKSLENVNYTGQWTNIPAGIERALYELKINGRKEAEKIIIFLTDGIVDTGNKEQDMEKLNWLKEELAQDSKNSGVRIYGIAFTDKADFSLIQSLALKTDGQYFRIFKAEEIQDVFTRISEAIKAPGVSKQTQPEPVTPVTTTPAPSEKETNLPATPEKKGGFRIPSSVILGGIIVLLLIIILFRIRKKPAYGVRVSTAADMPQAKLIDQQHVISSEAIEINKPHITIGRDPNTDITIPKETVSALHATISYENNAFYLEDQRSSNFTRLNNKKIAPNKPVYLKSGDRITFDIYHFQFVIPQLIPRGETVLKKDFSQEAADTNHPKTETGKPKASPPATPGNIDELPEQKTLAKPKPGISDEPPERKTLAKPKPGNNDEPPEKKTLPKPK